jgi:hypothetical protein
MKASMIFSSLVFAAGASMAGEAMTENTAAQSAVFVQAMETSGEAPASAVPVLTESLQSLETANSNLYRYLEMESRVRYVHEAIQIKESALREVYDLYDFEIISRYAFQSPSVDYKQAVGDFVVRNLSRYMGRARGVRDLELALQIEGRAYLVSQAKAVKEEMARVSRNENEFEVISRSAFASPSEAYRDMQSLFVAENVGRSLHRSSRLRIILQIESRCKFVRDAIAVKEEGLIAVRTRRDLYALSRSAFSNPSEAYLQATYEFTRRHEGRYP